MIINDLKNSVETKLNQFLNKHRINILAISIGIIYLWFGVLKLFPNWSPAESLATETLSIIVLHSIDSKVLLLILALVEVFIGVSLILRCKNKLLIYLVFIHLFGTLMPLFIMTETAFNKPPFGFSIIGQYILKNIVIISGLLIVFKKEPPYKRIKNEETI